MKPKKWSETKTLEFARTYRINPCLWDVNHKDYKRRNIREIVCTKIGKSFDCSPNEVRRKIKSLRSVYLQERNKIKDSISFNLNDMYVPSVIWYDEMDAVMNNGGLDASQSQTNVGFVQDDDDDDEQQTEVIDYEYDGKQDECSPNKEVTEEEPVSLPHRLRKIRPLASKKYDFESTNHKVNSNVSLNTSREVENDPSYNLFSAIEKLHEISVRSHVQEDEFDIFGRSVAQQLRNFNDIKTALRVQHKLQGVLSDERIMDIRHVKEEHCSSTNKRKELSDNSDSDLIEIGSSTKKIALGVCTPSTTDANQSIQN